MRVRVAALLAAAAAAAGAVCADARQHTLLRELLPGEPECLPEGTLIACTTCPPGFKSWCGDCRKGDSKELCDKCPKAGKDDPKPTCKCPKGTQEICVAMDSPVDDDFAPVPPEDVRDPEEGDDPSEQAPGQGGDDDDDDDDEANAGALGTIVGASIGAAATLSVFALGMAARRYRRKNPGSSWRQSVMVVGRPQNLNKKVVSFGGIIKVKRPDRAASAKGFSHPEKLESMVVSEAYAESASWDGSLRRDRDSFDASGDDLTLPRDRSPSV